MQLAKDSLTLFVRSLPKGCTFSIISFGSHFKAMDQGNNPAMEFNDSTRDRAISEIASFSSNFGGTNILLPMQAV